jgi:hypothetical protein
VLQTALGGVAFPGISVNGGSVSGITVIVSDQLADSTALLVDASQLLTASTPIRLDASEEAMLDMAGGNTPTFNLFQKNAVGFRAERMVAVHALRASAVQSLSGVGYSGGSPTGRSLRKHDCAVQDVPLDRGKRRRKSAAVG